MSSICQGFVQNAWRKDICSNCFRVRDEHTPAEINNSVNSGNGTSTSDSNSSNNNNSNGVSITAAIVSNNNGNGSNSNSGTSKNETNALLNAVDCGGDGKPAFGMPQKLSRFQGPNSTSYSSGVSQSPFGQGPVSAIPRINNGAAGTANSSCGIGGKFSGTNSTVTTTAIKGHHNNIHSMLNASKSTSNHNHSNHYRNENNDSTMSETKVKSSGEATPLATKIISASSSLLISANSSPITTNTQQQGKGVMTNQHPPKSDNANVISNHNHSSKQSLPYASAAVTSTVTTQHHPVIATGRSVSSSFIASKNIFNNAASSNSATGMVGAAQASTTATGFTTLLSTSSLNNGPSSNASGLSGCANGNTTIAVTPVSGSSGLSHPQSAISFKRGNIVSAASSIASALGSSTPTVSHQQNNQRNVVGGGCVVVVSCNSATITSCGASHQQKNAENSAKNGVKENYTGKKEFPIEAIANNSSCSNSTGGGGVCNSVSKGAVTVTQTIGMNKTKPLQPMDGTDGEITEKRKVGFSSANNINSNVAGSGSEAIVVSKVGGGSGSGTKPTPAAKHSNSKGILRKKNANKKRDKNVRFPEKVVEVIGYGGPSGTSDDEDDAPTDPLDSASVAEVLDKNATTSEEKELYRITQKNTNFNSIKTNLLGTTCIEIGPIVGCTGGKSVSGSSKPLVSIGTFETRKEPLRIHKKISEESADDELNEKTVEKHRKFIPKNNSTGGATSSNAATAKTLFSQPVSQSTTKINSSTPSDTNNANKQSGGSKGEAKQQATNVTSASSSSSTKCYIKTNTISSTASPNLNNSSSTTIATINSKTSTSNAKPSRTEPTTTSLSFDTNKGSGATTISNAASTTSTTIEVNPENVSSSHVMCNQKESVATTEASRNRSSIHCPSANTVTTSRILPSSNNVASQIPNNKWSSSSNNNNEAPSVKSKPVLKRIQQQKNSSESASSVKAAAVIESSKRDLSSTVGTNTTNLNGSRNNLIILTNGDKGSNNKVNCAVGISSSIATKRNSFLRDIIVDSTHLSSAPSTGALTLDASPGGIELCSQSGSSAGGVQIICKNNTIISHLEQDSLVKSELKVDLKPSVNNGKLSHPPFEVSLSNRSNGTDESSEFDDSLEDSGLDIKKCSEISESDEKSGSGSDSGNENDYSERDRVQIITTTGHKNGLFISVDEVEGTSKKPEKLSPDSVLFSSASEMSASGSAESIPEALDTISGSASDKSVSTAAGSDGGSRAGGPTSGAAKRVAPRPPLTLPPTDASLKENNAIYANSQASIVEVDGVYDDVSFYKNPMHFPSKSEKVSTVEEEDEEENIYDDCTTATIPKGNRKSAAGSYSFQSGSRTHASMDSGDEEIEKVVQRRTDGIEFIGIRKIDSESFLRERSPTPDSNSDAKRERSSSASPKTRRKVNQFFSTIGKRAGAAFSHHVQGISGKHKSSPVVIEDPEIETSPSGTKNKVYKRSLSNDEVSLTRTQIYATLTPTSLKFKGLAPVLHKLSKMDLHMGDKEKALGDDERDSKEKGYKKHKISSSIKKFLRFGSKDGESSGSKYEFGNCQNKTEQNISGSSQMITSQISEESDNSSASRTPTPTAAAIPTIKVPERKPSYATVSGRPPPPPPPRVHSLDLLNRVGVMGPHGTVRPARPPPPARQNRVAPSFTSVFTNPNGESENKSNTNTLANDGGTTVTLTAGDNPDPNNPPSKPKRKASMNLDCVTNGVSRDLETTYNHITTLNLETLKLIASQPPTKIRSSNSLSRFGSAQLKWSHFRITEPSKPLIQGNGFVFYTALFNDDSYVLLVQESVSVPNFSAPFEFPCVETSATFEDSIPDSFITWKASQYVTIGSSIKVFVSVMPKYSMYTVENYLRQSQVPLLHKYFALLQAMNHWDVEDMSDLLVLVQSMEESDRQQIDLSQQPSSVLVYVHPIPHISIPGQTKSGSKSLPTRNHFPNFETAMKQLLLNSDGPTSLLGNNDRQVLLKRIKENKTKTVQDQIRLFLQVKLFAPKRDSEEMERIKKLRSERAIQQWLDRERAICMKEAVEQTLQRNVESSISPYKRSYLEFLLTPENSAKAVLGMMVDLLEY